MKLINKTKKNSEFRIIIEKNADGIIVVNKNGTILFLNPAAEKFMGRSSNELIGTMLGFPLVEDKPSEVNIICKDGSVVLLEMRAVKIKWADKDSYIISLRDIKERKAIEEELRKSEERFRSVAESAIDAIINIDTNEQITFWNQGAYHMFGYSKEDIIGKHFSKLISKRFYESKYLIDSSIIGIVSKGKTTIVGKSIEMIGVKKNGDEFPFELSLAVWQTSDGVYFTIIARDISDRKILQRQLSQAQKLESIGQLAAGIAHEINTPTQYVGDNIIFLKDAFNDISDVLSKYEELLKTIKSNSAIDNKINEIEELIKKVDIKYLMEEIPQAISQSLGGINAVSKIVKSMKEFSHPGSAEKVAVDINKAIENIITVSRNEWKYVAEVVTNFDNNIPMIPCLPGEFNQAILNMIINAAHAIADIIGKNSEKKGKITISTCLDGEWVEIRITDTGSGIDDKIKDRIFDPFFTTKDVGKGTGQGLAISHNVIVEKHGGEINFESEKLKGTTFIVKLPIEIEKGKK
ncbi:MAG: PAS domain S-box protein [Desulfobacterales bacterium]|nr:PAS domain S-box protein [Desulfobacterales bacterium]MBF0395726.1 PAS domain S-box protein [Desulfobacterales bacterium]